MKPIWDEKDLHTGNGITPSVPTIILPCDPIALVERLDILMASNAAGNTGIRNELVSVCDELLRQNLIDKHAYKIMMLQLQNVNNKEMLQKEICHWRYLYLRFLGYFFARMFSNNAAK